MFFSRAPSPEFRLKLLDKADAQPLYAAIRANRDHLRQWLPWVDTTRSELDSKAFIDDAMQKYFKGEGVVHGIWYDNTLVGCIGINDISQAHRKAALGYWLDQAYQDRGIMTRASRQMISYAFTDLKLNRMEILCASRNYRSRAVAQRLGFYQEAVLREYYWQHGEYVDMLLYSMLRRDWKDG
jgi:ribosomal-protein-serine acetyltransferase